MSADDLLYSPMTTASSFSASVSTQPSNDIRIPNRWLDVINRLRSWDTAWEQTALAGGALRDLDLGRPIKDVDIFMPHAGLLTESSLENCLSAGYNETVCVIEHKHDPKSNSALSNGMICPSHFTFYMDGWRFEITQKIEPFTQRDIIDSFDLGICMIALEDLKIYRSPEYINDVANRNITIVRETGGREIPHAERIQRKYPGWAIVQP